jgi:MFS superfamily sulfate permease-like transporter
MAYKAVYNRFLTLRDDFPAGISVFLVAVPLCLGIAHASGAPILSGLVSGIIGGIVVGTFSKSQLSVTGPAAGLTAIVLNGITELGSFEAFLVALTLAGVFQFIFGVFKWGGVAAFIPTSVINGMLSAIGVLLIINQFPHMIGLQVLPKDSTKGIFDATFLYKVVNPFILSIGLSCMVLFIFWDRLVKQRNKLVPGALAAVLLGSGLAYVFRLFNQPLQSKSFVQLRGISSINEFLYATHFPDWQVLLNYNVFIIAFAVAIIASVETLLSVEAIDKLDPYKRKSPPNRELMAQGLGNTICGLLGGIPLTAVIVRGSVNVNAGGRTRLSSIVQGSLLLIALVFFSSVFNYIPIASLAAILVYTGYKLFMREYLLSLWATNKLEAFVFVITIAAVVLTDLLIGVLTGWILQLTFSGNGKLLLIAIYEKMKR